MHGCCKSRNLPKPPQAPRIKNPKNPKPYNPKALNLEALDPADGELDVGRAARKRAQAVLFGLGLWV